MGINYQERTDLSKSIHNISEPIFIEITNEDKNALVGCIYRHHFEISEFIEQYFDDALNQISKEKIRSVHF